MISSTLNSKITDVILVLPVNVR